MTRPEAVQSSAGTPAIRHPLYLKVNGLDANSEPLVTNATAVGYSPAQVRAYLGGLACALPAALLFTAFRGFSTAVSRPKAVMALQLGALALKIPLSALLVHGAELATPLGTRALASQGAAGCAGATAIVMNLQTLPDGQLTQRFKLAREGAEKTGHADRFSKVPLAVSFQCRRSTP